MRRTVVALVALAVLVVSPAVASAQASGDLDGEIQILRADDGVEGQVTLQVAVPLSVGALAPTEDNFGILDGGQLINNFTVSAVTTAVDVVVALDTSGSMQGAKMTAAKQAASTFVLQLPESARVGLLTFDDEVVVRQEVGADRQALLDDIASLEASTGETSLWDGLVEAASAVDGAEQPFVVVLSDGEDTVSTTSQSTAIGALRRAEASLYAVAIESSDTDLQTLETLTRDVGGQFFDTEDLGELESLYSDIAGRLASRYELSYPTSRTDAREVSVSVAADGAVRASASVTLGSGEAEIASASTGSETPQVLNLPEGARLGAVPAPSPGVLGGGSGLLIGAGFLFASFAIIGLMAVMPGTRVHLDTAVGVDRVVGLRSRAGQAADRFVARRDEEGTLDRALDAAGINLRPGEFVLLTFAGTILLGMFLSVAGGRLLGIAGAALGVVIALSYLNVRTSRRRAKFADQLVDTLGIMAGGLRAGRGLPQAIELVSQEAPSPTSDQFQRVVFETRVGRDMTESMLTVADRMENQDLEWVARAVDINRELGGDLTETLDNLANTIRERRRIARQVQALSAEGRASGWVLLALPIVMFLFMVWRSPQNASLLWTESFGRVLLGLGILGMIVGYFWIRRLTNLKY